MFSLDALSRGIKSGLLEFDRSEQTDLSPGLILNDREHGEKVLSYILENLEQCKSFHFAVAFVTTSGVACIHQTLKDAIARGCKGEILVSRYLNFSDPVAIEKLRHFDGVTIRFIEESDFHGKLFYFTFEKFNRLLIGSSNLTQAALGKNTEVNLNLSLSHNAGLNQKILTHLEKWTRNTNPVSDDELAAYADTWGKLQAKKAAVDAFLNETNSVELFESIQPNSMQVEALKQLDTVRLGGAKRTLVISATGTGKTVLSALDVKQFGAKRLLFVVHRLNIAKKAMLEYQKVFGTTKTMGIYSGTETSSLNSQFVFATVQTINAEHHLQNFDSSAFDYIIIDESHHAAANTYQRVLDYFRPAFLLGMTATPERTDGFDIFELFHHSIAYEIRLHDALEADLLVPFHYFGVSDITLDGVTIGDKSQFNKLVSNQRADYIIKTLEDYGCCDGNPRGLIFCSQIDEATQLSILFNQRGLKSIALSGSNTESERESAIQKLESNNISYIFTVDIFNEGIDIPSVNQVVMLRPTQSAIVFVQQLGRGLRKTKFKEYLTVIDFIGNYENNFLVPVAIFGDASFNKDKLRRLMTAGSDLMPGECSISFDRIAKERILSSITNARVDSRKALTTDYHLLKFRIGRHPRMLDFLLDDHRDPYQYVENYGSLLAFRNTIDKSLNIELELLNLLGYLVNYVFDGVRAEESIIFIQLTRCGGETNYKKVREEIKTQFGYSPSDSLINSALHSLNLRFVTQVLAGKNTAIGDIKGYNIVQESKSVITFGTTLNKIENAFFNDYLLDAAQCSVKKFAADFTLSDFNDGFKRGTKYSRRDVFRILQWTQNPNAQNVGGYVVSQDKSQCPIFLNYHKDDSISATTKYEDHFESPDTLIYMSKSRRSLESPDVAAIANQSMNNMRIPIFVKKSNDEGLSFYYLGDGRADPSRFIRTNMKDNPSVSVVQMTFTLDKPVPSDLYKYLTTIPLSLDSNGLELSST
jgi:superfamily II DNA or RNA helicase/HKD family nuclease